MEYSAFTLTARASLLLQYCKLRSAAQGLAVLGRVTMKESPAERCVHGLKANGFQSHCIECRSSREHLGYSIRAILLGLILERSLIRASLSKRLLRFRRDESRLPDFMKT